MTSMTRSWAAGSFLFSFFFLFCLEGRYRLREIGKEAGFDCLMGDIQALLFNLFCD